LVRPYCRCSSEGYSANANARTFANVSNVGFGIGLVGLATSLGLYWCGKREAAMQSASGTDLRFGFAWSRHDSIAIAGSSF
jgi:hypothetical protein